MKYVLSIFFTIFVCASAYSSKKTYTVKNQMLPTDLRLELELNAPYTKTNFIRYLTFKNLKNDSLAIPIEFSQISTKSYTGHATAEGLATLQLMARPNYRSYWDKMFLENRGDSGTLDISSIKGHVRYDQTCCNREQEAMIIYNMNFNLGPHNDSKALDGTAGRMIYAMNYLGVSHAELMSYPKSLQDFISDIGKSGSSDASDSSASRNHKYGLGKSLCSETVSWYYSHNGVKITDASNPSTLYDYKNITAHTKLYKQFQAADRLYCFHADDGKFYKWTAKNDWDYAEEYSPLPGDYLDRGDSDKTDEGDDGHAMMIVRWDERTGVATVLDGPWNINFREEKIRAKEKAHSFEFCVGRIPEND